MVGRLVLVLRGWGKAEDRALAGCRLEEVERGSCKDLECELRGGKGQVGLEYTYSILLFNTITNALSFYFIYEYDMD